MMTLYDHRKRRMTIPDIDIPIEARIDLWRQKAIAGTLSLEETREAVRIMREGRVGASIASAASKVKSTPADGASILARLMGKTE